MSIFIYLGIHVLMATSIFLYGRYIYKKALKMPKEK